MAQKYDMFKDTEGLTPMQMAYLIGAFSSILDAKGVIRKGDVQRLVSKAKELYQQ